MSLDEKLFGWGVRAYRSAFRKAPPPVPGEVALSDLALRLGILASALAGKAIEIKEAETVGGPSGPVLFLPKTLVTQAYVYRTAFSMTLAELHPGLPPDFLEIPEAQIVMTLLGIPFTRARLRELYPGLKAIEPRVLADELRGRPGIEPARTREDALDSLIRALLAEAPPARPHPWVTDALARGPIPPEHWEPETRALLPELLRLRSRGRGAILATAPAVWGLILPRMRPGAAATAKGAEPPAAEGTLPSGTEKKGKPKERVEEAKLREDREGENPLVHAFEKLRTADDYIGGRKALDGTDELEEHLEALEELDLRKVIRSRDRTDSVYKSDVMLETGIGDLAEDNEVADFTYDEWDAQARAYKKDWCRLHVQKPPRVIEAARVEAYVRQALARNQRQIRALTREFEEFTCARRWRTRQPDGPEIDLEAVVDRYAAVKSGHAGPNYLYLSQRPRERDYATLVLLDSSLSTDAWLQNRRVMDVLKEAMLVLGQVVSDFHDRLAIGAFFSNTRNDCRYVEVKRFEESWLRCLPRLVALQPTGYTRIGPALRHGTHLLGRITTKKKLLLLISDGKPTDYDRYEGRYGVEDIRQAIREAARENITVRALAIEAQAKLYLPRMFGSGNFQILPSPALLGESLTRIHGWLKAR